LNVTNFLALKFLSGKDRSFLLSFLTWMAVLGVLVSVLAFVVVEAVMSGFNKDLQSKILGFSSHLTLTLKPDQPPAEGFFKDLQNDKVEAITHFLDGEAILRTEEGETQGVKVRGLDPQRIFFPKDFRVMFEEGEGWESLRPRKDKLPGIILGMELASSVAVVPSLLEKVELLYPFGEIGPTGEVEPNIRAFRVVGVFKTGYFDYDKSFAILDLGEAKRIFGENQSEKVGIFLKDPHQADVLKKSFQTLPGVEQVKSWGELNSRLFSALKLERMGMALVLTLMILLASFNILSMLMMLVFERRQEIAVLKALGLSEKKISSIFYRAGLWIGISGGVGGCLLGTLLCWALATARIRLPSPYYIEALPIQISLPLLGITLLLAVVLSLMATLLPARVGKGLTVVEALRCE
jgi:lipoprotein-releasing system permease protein